MGMARGGEELALLVMKTALASGMKNSLALVVKNGLPPMVKNALAGVTGGGKKEAVRLREQCTCGAREQMAYAIGNFASQVTSLALQAGRNFPAA